MSKRKRSHSQTASQRFHSNPFLCHVDTQEKQESEQGNKSNKRFHAFLSFVELSKEKTGEDVNLKITKVVNELLFTLSAPVEEEQNGGFMISSLDIVGLLLPWAIQNILRSQNDPFECKTHWHTLERCLQYLALSSQNSSDVSSKAFSLSTLNKLVPMAGNIAFLGLPTLGEIAGSCFCLLVDHFYKAPFDVVCDTLLKMVGDDQVCQIKESDRILQSMVLSTLRLLCARIKKANPKKSFQLLVKPSLFKMLAEIYVESTKWPESAQPLVRQLLVTGLFDLDHHIDGFRSIKMEVPILALEGMMDLDAGNDAQKSDFQCYQQNLFTMIRSELSIKNGKVGDKAEVVIQLLPLLMESFIEQTLALQQQIRDKTTNRKKASGNKITKLQFGFFAFMATFLMQPYDHFQLRNFSYVSLEKCLRLLLEHDVYLPSNEDDNQDQFTFLSNLAQGLILRMKTTEGTSPRLSMKEWENALEMFDVLVRLNHLILHDHMPTITAFCLTYKNKICRKSSEFLSSSIMTYKKLRQLDYFSSSFVAGIDLMKKDQNDEGLDALIALIEDPNTRSSLSAAICSSPINQVKDIFLKINDWIVDVVVHSIVSDTESTLSHSTLLSISAVINTFVILIKNVEVDMNLAQEIFPLCSKISHGSVNRLLSKYRELSSEMTLAKKGLLLYGWIMNLENRCKFWMQNSTDSNGSQIDVPKELLCILEEATDSSDENHKLWGYSLSEKLQFLSCQRIHQLHSEIHERQQIAFATDDLEFNNNGQIDEATNLVQFMLRTCGQDESGNHLSRLRLLSKSIASWAPYADKTDMHLFLSKLFLELASNELPTLTNSDLPFLEDAEFYETIKVADTLGTSLLSCITDLSLLALNDCLSSMTLDIKTLLRPIKDPLWKRTCPTDVNQVVEGSLEISISKFKHDSTKRKKYLLGIVHSLQRLKEIRASLWVDKDSALDGFDSIMRLDLVFRSFFPGETEIDSLVVEILSSLREVAAQILESIVESKTASFIGDNKTFGVLLKTTSRTCMEVVESKTIDSHAKIACINANQRLIGVITECYSQSPDSLVELSKGVNAIFLDFKSSSNDHTILVSTAFSWCIVRKLTAVKEDSEAWRIPITDITNCIHNCVWKDALQISFDQSFQEQAMKQSAILTVAELLKYSSLHSESTKWLTKEMMQSLVEEVSKNAFRMLQGRVPDHEAWPMSYLVASLALLDLPHSVRINLANGIIRHLNAPNKVLETAFCTLVEGMEVDALRDTLSKLASFAVGEPETATRLRLFRALLLNLAPTDKLPVLSDMARRFYFLSLQSLTSQRGCRKEKGAKSAVLLLIEMASNRDIISISERDVALILAYINSAMNNVGSEKDAGHSQVESTIYESSFLMISFLLQRFPKQLYSCVSLTVSVIASMFRHTLYDCLDESEVVNRCQKFTRVCELLLPHRDVYKKHVICLLVEFVKALKGDLDLKRKTCLAPAIYCLLDILQQHETTQLNCMLDEMGRALLRSVHKNYQKLHVYKGQ